jgi:hypothetical protein
LKAITKARVVVAFHYFFSGNSPMGIYAVPIESLHAWILGIIEYMLEGIYNHFIPSMPISNWLENRYNDGPMGSMAHHPVQPKSPLTQW